MEWQPIETAPKDGTEILGAWCYLPDVWFVHPIICIDGSFVVSWDHDGEIKPTHWMPLPDPPPTT